MFKNVIFDVGDTLINFGYRPYMSNLGFDDATVEFLVDNMIFTDFWEDMDAGRKDMDEACAFFCEKYPDLKNEITAFWTNIEDIVSEYDFAYPLVMEMKEKGYKVFLLSNYPAKLADIHWPKFSFFERNGWLYHLGSCRSYKTRREDFSYADGSLPIACGGVYFYR